MPRRQLRTAGALLAKHYKLGCSGLQSKQLHLKAQAAHGVHTNPTVHAGALVYQKSPVASAPQCRWSSSGSSSSRHISSIHSFAAQPYVRVHMPRASQHAAVPRIPHHNLSASRPVHFRPPCFAVRAFCHRSTSCSPRQHSRIAPVSGRILRRLVAPSLAGLRASSSAEPRIERSSSLWGLFQLSSRNHSSSRDSGSSRDLHALGRRHDRLGQSPTAFQAGLAELCRDQRAQRAQRAHRAGINIERAKSRDWEGALAEELERMHQTRRSPRTDLARTRQGGSMRRSQVADLAAGLTAMSGHRDLRSGHLARQRLSPSTTNPSAQKVTQSHGGLDRLAYAMHMRSQSSPSPSASGLARTQSTARSSDRHRARQLRNRAAFTTLQTIFE